MSENSEQTTTEKVMNVSDLKPVESSGEIVDLKQYHKKEVEIEFTKIVQVNSNYTDNNKQWVLKVSSKVLHTIGEGDDKIEFRASELFNLSQDRGKIRRLS